MASLLLSSCVKDELPSVDDNFLNYQIPNVTVTQDCLVGAYYYDNGLTGLSSSIYDRLTGIIDKTTGKVGPWITPILGNYNTTLNSTSFTNIQQHIDWAIEAKIDFFVLPSISEVSTALYPNNINANNLKIVNAITGKIGADGLDATSSTGPFIDMKSVKYVLSINLSNVYSGLSNTTLIEKVSSSNIGGQTVTRVQRFNDAFKRLSDFFSDPKYYKVEGKPMVVIYNPQLIYSQASDTLYNNMRQYVKEYSGFDMFLVAQQPCWTPPARYEYLFIKGKVDAVTHVNMYNQSAMYDRSYWYPQAIDQNWKYSKDFFLANWNIDFIPSISPSFSQYVYNGVYNYPIVSKSQENFTAMCNVAKHNLGKRRLVFIDSFNEWQRDTQIEPTDSTFGNGYGKTYLRITKEQFKVK
jgi:hypothetical protein